MWMRSRRKRRGLFLALMMPATLGGKLAAYIRGEIVK
jgi:hypothetical protein